MRILGHRIYFVIIASLGIASCGSKLTDPSDQKPESIVVPVAILGEVSDIRRKILQNTLNETISTKFRIVPQERFEQAQEQAFLELDYEECTEDQCIMLIQEMLQVEHLFQLEVIAEGKMIQLSLKLATIYEKKNKTDLCENCTTRQLVDRLRQLTLSLLAEVDTSDMEVVYQPIEVEKKETAIPQKIEPKVEPPESVSRHQEDAGVEGVRDESLTGVSTKQDPEKEETDAFIEEPEPKPEIESTDESKNFRIRVLSGSFSGSGTNVSNLSYAFHWYGVGLGMSNLSYKLKSSGNSYELTGQTYDLSYTSGDSWSWTVAFGTVASGSGTISSSSNTYETSKLTGSTFSGLVGIGWGSLEGLAGYQSFSLSYEGFKNQSGISLSKPLSVSVGLFLLGIGVSF